MSATAAATPLHRRYKPRSSPLAGVDLRTTTGRRIREHALALLAGDTSDPFRTERAILAAKVRLKVERVLDDERASPEAVAMLLKAADVAEAKVGTAS